MITVEELESSIEDAYQEGREVGYDLGYEQGKHDGDIECRDDLQSWYEEKISDLNDEHERELEKEYKKGMDDKDEELSPVLENLRYHMETHIEQLQSQIIELKKQNLKLRIENATITRSIQKST